MRLRRQTYQELLEALLSAYDAPSFAQMLRVELDKTLTHYAPVNASLTEIITAVIDASEREGWTEELVLAAARYNPGNQDLQHIVSAWQSSPEGIQAAPGRERRAWPLWVKAAVSMVTVVLLFAIGAAILSRLRIFSVQPTAAPATPAMVPETISEPIALTSTTCTDGVAPTLEQLDKMVLIPGGTFVMGDNIGERPQHRVAVESFWIDKYEVTNYQYQRYVRESGASAPTSWTNEEWPPGQTAFQPVVYVTWREAADYCAAQGKRLPTEAEWEYSCRGSGNHLFPWGDDIRPGIANTQEAGCEQALSVGAYSPDSDSEFGVADLAGNVMEWVASLARPYPYSDDGRNALEDASQPRIVRGGAWIAPQEFGTCTIRSSFPPDVANDHLGFRCAANAAAAP